MTITEFLEARIAEDERWAGESSAGPWAAGTSEVESRGGRVADVDGYGNLIHIARHDPARVLAECAAKRAIIDAVEPGQWYSNPSHSGYSDAMGVVIDTLAMVYKDHPDYRKEWAL